MIDYRIKKHPIIDVKEKEEIPFFWNGKKLKAKNGEVIASALFANGIKTFSFHQKDNAPQGIFCANGQCSQCLVVANGKTVKSCMVKVSEGMHVEPLRGLPNLPKDDEIEVCKNIKDINTEVLIIGGGPAGLSAAIELGKNKVNVILVDDKSKLGGKLVLQTHKFFGSVKDSFAGTRGFEIGRILSKELEKYPNVKVWLNTSAIGIYSDKKVGVLKNNDEYILITPKILLNTTGAREKSLTFPGNTLPGVYGAGAFQTLVNRDLIKASDRIFIIGGGNVGLIAAYHALQANMNVVGLIEAMKKVGGYKVHQDKLMRMGVPIYTQHTVVSANGDKEVESVTVAQIDEKFKVITGTEKTFKCDTVLIAVGLNPVNEFHEQALAFGMKSYAAGDAQEIAEASAAMFSGKISGLEIAKKLKKYDMEIPGDWSKKMDILKSKPGKVKEQFIPDKNDGVYPIFQCNQEIPCNPCTSVCPKNAIYIDPDNMMKDPVWIEENGCIGCMQCVSVCPGLAISVVDFRKDSKMPIVTLPYEYGDDTLKAGDSIEIMGQNIESLGNYKVISVKKAPNTTKTYLVQIKMPADLAKKAGGIKVQTDKNITAPLEKPDLRLRDDDIVCRCERITAGEIRKWIRRGVTDLNQLKAITRAGMGSCGGKTCQSIIEMLMRQEGVPQDKIVRNTLRPLFFDTPLKYFAGIKDGKENE